jgi:uncharacterized membrane protein
MAFCTQCGNRVGDADQFCAGCGSPQRGQSRPEPGRSTTAGAGSQFRGIFDNLTPRKASLLCYIPVIGWVPSIVMLSSERFQQDRQVRFHAFQGLYLFVAWLLADWVVGPMFRGLDLHVEGLLKAAVFCAWIFMIVKTSQNEHYRLPVFGELAERSANEQR